MLLERLIVGPMLSIFGFMIATFGTASRVIELELETQLTHIMKATAPRGFC